MLIPPMVLEIICVGLKAVRVNVSIPFLQDRYLEKYEVTWPNSTRRGVAKLCMKSTFLRVSLPSNPSVVGGHTFPSSLAPAKVHFEVR